MLVPIFIAFSLNFDTFSVSIVEGAQATHKPTIIKSLKVAFIFATVQVLLAYLGALLGMGFKTFITNTDHWIAFLLLSAIGIKMIKESLQKENCESKTNSSTNFNSLVFLAIATSIDALIVGITIAFMKESTISYMLSIGIITFFVSYFGYHSGRGLKKICGNHVKAIGGLILIVIGLKTLIQHLFFGG